MKKAIIFLFLFVAVVFAQVPPYSVMVTVQFEDGTFAPELVPNINVTDISTGNTFNFTMDNEPTMFGATWYNPSTGMTNFDINGNDQLYVQEPGDLLSGTFMTPDGLYTATLAEVAMNSAGFFWLAEPVILEGGGSAIEGMVVEAVAMDGAAKINWKAIETNNAAFIVNGTRIESKVGTSTETQTYSHVINNLENGVEYTFSIQAVSETNELSEAMTVNVVPVAGATGEVPVEYNLNQNYPNPFNPTTNIKFSVPEAGMVSLKLFNVMGQEVATLVNDYYHPAVVNYTLDAANLATGVYFYRIDVNNFSDTKKMALVK